MKIGWISTFDIDQRRGGWQGFCYHLFQALSVIHNDIEIIAPVQVPSDQWNTWRSRVLTLTTGKRLVHSHSDFYMRKLAQSISNKTNNLDVDVYLFIGNGAYYKSFPSKPFACFTDSGFVPFLKFYNQSRNYAECEYHRLLEREGTWYSKINRVFTTSEFARQEILSYYSDAVKEVQICNVHTGPNLDYQPISIKPVNKPSILFICTDFYRKGGELAVQAVDQVREQIPNIEIHLVGTKPPPEYNRNYIHVHGWVDRSTAQGKKNWEQIMSNCALLLSLPKQDLTPGAILEAAAYGLPTLSLAVGGIPEMIDNGKSGWLLPAQSSAGDIAQALLKIFESPEKIFHFGQKARKCYESTWNWNAVASKILEELKSIST